MLPDQDSCIRKGKIISYIVLGQFYREIPHFS